jgi:D-alanyl-D-alanine carboxypeptidase
MTTLEAALAQIDAFAAGRMASANTPGAALALTDRERTLAGRCYGHADIAARAPITPDTLLEIGSIGKLFTAIGLVREIEAGRLDPHRPLGELLPWFELPSDFAPVTPHHLLCHSAGIPTGPDHTPEARYQVWALRERRAAFPPGSRFHYSNLGYKALGLLLEHLTGEPYPAAIARRVLAPLGMDASAPAITAALRPRMAVGYAALHDDRPWHPSRPLVAAPFVETATGDGSVAATAGDMARFARMLLGRGTAPEGRVLDEAEFARLTGDGYRFDDDHIYAYGVNVQRVDGRTLLWHHGGMPGFSAHLRCDLDDGLGAVALLNGAGSPMALATFALACLRAWRHGEQLPDVPPPLDRTRVEGAEAYAGAYVLSGEHASAAERTLVLEAQQDRLYLARHDGRAALEPQGDDAFFVPHPELDGFPLRFGRDEGGRVVEATHGASWYTGEGYAGPLRFAHPPEWAAYPGRYRAHNPWVPSVAVALRKGRLHLLWTSEYDGAGGDEDELVPLGDGSFRVGADEGGPEWVRFGATVEGRALELTLSGSPMFRV